jgi:outer membrane protein OmpA-like peptidoglycan-associated protein
LLLSLTIRGSKPLIFFAFVYILPCFCPCFGHSSTGQRLWFLALKNITQKEIFVSALGLFGSSKLTVKAVVIALAAGLLGAGAVVVAPADPANATSCTGADSVYAGGDGSSGSPFQIATAAQLIRLSLTKADWQNKYFIQTADIDLGNCVWAPIGDTTMTSVGLSYNGQGFTISGLRPSSNVLDEGTGLFGAVIAFELRNLTVKGSVTYSELNDAFFVGGVIGLAYESTLDNVRSEVDISVTTESMGIGGLIGGTYNVSISQSSYKGFIQTSSGLSDDEAGGLVGFSRDSLAIASSYALANFGVSSGVTRAGLLGKVDSLYCSSLTVSNSYFVGSGAEYGVLKDGDCGQYSDTFWNSEVSSSSATSSGTLTGTAARTTAQLKSFANFPSSWNIVDGWNAYSATAPIKTWGICSSVNSGYPFLLREHSSNACTVAPPTSNTGSGSSGSVSVAPVVVPEVVTPRTIRQPTISEAAGDRPARLLGRSLDKDVLFIADSAKLSPQAKKSLRQAARLAKASDGKVAVTGFAAITSRGSSYEKSVAQKRALAVARYLRAQGFDDWIYYQGLSGRQGLAFDGDPRRVEIRILN